MTGAVFCQACGGVQAEESKTVIPSKALANISYRLVPNQTPQEITQKLGDYLRTIAPEGLTVEVLTSTATGR